MELKTARRIARLTQQQLAEKAGVDHSTISLIETGKRGIRSVAYETVVRIARALGVEPAELFPILEESRESETDKQRRLPLKRKAS